MIPLILTFVVMPAMLISAVWLSLQQHTFSRRVRHTLEVKSELNALQSVATDAETGQRGFLLTGRANYILPYEHARDQLPTDLTELGRQLQDDPTQAGRIPRLDGVIGAKLAELQSTIDRRRACDCEAPCVSPISTAARAL